MVKKDRSKRRPGYPGAPFGLEKIMFRPKYGNNLSVRSSHPCSKAVYRRSAAGRFLSEDDANEWPFAEEHRFARSDAAFLPASGGLLPRCGNTRPCSFGRRAVSCKSKQAGRHFVKKNLTGDSFSSIQAHQPKTNLQRSQNVLIAASQQRLIPAFVSVLTDTSQQKPASTRT